MSESLPHRGRVLYRGAVAANVHQYVIEKPKGFTFRPGQAVDFAIDQPEWREQLRPFTLTSLPDNPRLEFIIKSYPLAEHPDHEGMTEHLGNDIQVGDYVLFSEAWGAIEYRGPGVFIAGGAGVTPFVAILRHLEQQGKLVGNRLFSSNRRPDEVILQGEFARMLGDACLFTLTQTQHRNYEFGRVDRQWLEAHLQRFEQPFYLCGPPKMVEELSQTLKSLGADTDSLVFEK